MCQEAVTLTLIERDVCSVVQILAFGLVLLVRYICLVELYPRAFTAQSLSQDHKTVAQQQKFSEFLDTSA